MMYKYYPVLALILMQMSICCTSINTVKTHQTLDLRIMSPFNCDYQLIIDGNKLRVQSQQYNQRMSDSAVISSDTMVFGYDTLVADSIVSLIYKYLDVIKNNKVIYDSIRGNDSYLYEVYAEGKLLIHKDGFDKDAFELIGVLRPYVREEKIKCCDFFDSFDRVK